MGNDAEFGRDVGSDIDGAIEVTLPSSSHWYPIVMVANAGETGWRLLALVPVAAMALLVCVTHAQVSVNPDNMRVGYHTDWASSFPFAQLGLPDNYARPLPAMVTFGFEYDETFAARAGTRLFTGVELAEQELAREAAGRPVAELRKALRKRYRARLAEAMRGEEAGR